MESTGRRRHSFRAAKWLLVFLALGVAAGCAPSPEEDLALVDAYLFSFARYASGDEERGPDLVEQRGAAEAALVRLLECDDRRAPARAVLLAVLAVGGGIEVDSPLGRALSRWLPEGTWASVGEEGAPVFFAGALHRWWERERAAFPRYEQLEAWEASVYAQRVVIPYYEAVLSGRAQPSESSEDVGESRGDTP